MSIEPVGALMPGAELDLEAELDDVERSLREITLMLEQSQNEVNKLTQRNAAITSHLQQVLQADRGSLEEVRMAYDSALDAQQRLLLMRGQLEKLQGDKSHLERLRAVLLQARNLSASGPTFGRGGGEKGAFHSVEMLINAQEAERQRLSRQMHDGPAQALSNFILQAEIAMRLLDVDPAQARDELNNLKVAAMSTFQKVRNFIFELRPMMLDDLGLIPTIRRYADTFKEQSGLDVNVNVSGTERRLEPYLEVMVFRALQELLGNAARHGRATMVKVHVDVGDDQVKVSVDDNGKGFDSDVASHNGLGLKLIRERVEMMGGTFELDSVPGKGTRVAFSVPAGIYISES
ncbi:MAG: ATP-binding protein [Candidatus Villigracilaceae bacterium]